MLTRTLRRVSRCYSTRLTVSAPDENIFKTPGKKKTQFLPESLYGGRRIVTLIPGDGIGPELMRHVKDIFKVTQVPVDFEEISASGDETKRSLVNNALMSIQRNRIGLKGNMASILEDEGFVAPNVELRDQLDTFAYVVHYKSYPVATSKFPNLDILLIRQNTEGEFMMLEHENVKGVVESMKIMTRDNTERLAHFAFRYALDHGRKKITIIHKKDVMRLSDGLFVNTVRGIQQEYPAIAVEEMPVDHCCRKLVSNPTVFDVLLMPNLYGAITSNIICGTIGGPGLYCGVNYGENVAVFEPATRHTGTDIMGKNVANPIAMLSASAKLLQFLDKGEHGKLIMDAINNAILVDKISTPDMGGENSTLDMVKSIKAFILENFEKRNLSVF